MEQFKVKNSDWHKKVIDNHIKYQIPYLYERIYKSKVEYNSQRDFCSYFRAVFAYLIKFSLTAFTIGAYIFGTIAIIAYVIFGIDPSFHDTNVIAGSIYIMIYAISGVVNACAIIFSVIMLIVYTVQIGYRKLDEMMQNLEWNKRKTGKKKRPSIIIAKVKSIKSKFCPAIEFEKESE